MRSYEVGYDRWKAQKQCVTFNLGLYNSEDYDRDKVLVINRDDCFSHEVDPNNLLGIV